MEFEMKEWDGEQNQKQQGAELEKLRCRIRNSGGAELEIVGCRIGNSKVWNWKQWGAELEMAGMELETVGCELPTPFSKMQSSHELPTLSSTSTMQSLTPKMQSSHELPTPQ